MPYFFVSDSSEVPEKPLTPTRPSSLSRPGVIRPEQSGNG